MGIPGSGKTFFGQHFAETFNAPYINPHHIASQSGISDDAAHTVSHMVLKEILKTGRAVVFDGQSHARTERQALAAMAKQAGYVPLFIWVQTESVAAKQRASKRTHNGQGLDSHAFDTQVKRFSPPHESERAVVISGKHTYPSQLKIVLKRLIVPREQATNVALPVRHASDRHKLIR